MLLILQGSLLKLYFKHWKTTDSKDNFFYWLDEGEGKDLDIDGCTRKELENNRVIYLNATERQDYLVTVQNGLLYYEKRFNSLFFYLFIFISIIILFYLFF